MRDWEREDGQGEDVERKVEGADAKRPGGAPYQRPQLQTNVHKACISVLSTTIHLFIASHSHKPAGEVLLPLSIVILAFSTVYARHHSCLYQLLVPRIHAVSTAYTCKSSVLLSKTLRVSTAHTSAQYLSYGLTIRICTWTRGPRRYGPLVAAYT